jgi:hypothetical protein
MYAAIGTDGKRPVVWGLGRDSDAALDDALANGYDGDMITVVIDDATAKRVESGEVSCESLGIELTAGEISEIA